ncbi:MAG: hypothetical protein H8E00_00420 [Deltaproteobacteria bacterium]|nr:hypothetical protein [Deltaproteobacteria bacterium]
MRGLVILTPDSVKAGCWQYIYKDIESQLVILDSFWVAPLPISAVGSFYGWPESITFGMTLKARLFSLGMSYVLFVNSQSPHIDPSIVLNKLKGSSKLDDRSPETFRAKYGAINSFLNLIHTSDDSICAIRDYDVLLNYKLKATYNKYFSDPVHCDLCVKDIFIYYANIVFCRAIITVMSKVTTGYLGSGDGTSLVMPPNNHNYSTVRQWLAMLAFRFKQLKDNSAILVNTLCEWNKFSPFVSKQLPILLDEANVIIDDWTLLILQTSIYSKILTDNKECL